MTIGRPRVTLKVAASLDGRTAMASGESRWVTGEAAREDVQRLRAASSAVLTGIGTVLADDPSLTVRSAACDTAGRAPLRVVVDSDLRMPVTARMLGLPGETLVACADDTGRASLETAGAEVLRCQGSDRRVDLEGLLGALGKRGCNDVLVEAGPALSGSLVSAGLVDELVVYIAPHLMGDAGRGMFGLPGLDRMADRVQLEVLDTRRVGEDLRIRARIRQERT